MNLTVSSYPLAAVKEPSGSPAYRRDIDGLRATAVVAVLVFHAFPQQLPGGFVGVDVFFVISGFLITQVILSMLKEGTFSLKEFYMRRLLRIFPALALVLAACLAFGWKTLLAEDLMQLAKHAFFGAAFSSNLLLWQEAGYFDAASESKPLLHLWSLGVEEQFYIVWPLAMWWAFKRGISLTALIWATALVSFAFNVGGIASHATATFYSPLSRGWELLMGAGLACLGTSNCSQWRRAARNIASLIGISLIAFAAFRLKASDMFPGWWALLPSFGAWLLIWAGPQAWANRLLLARRPMVAVGLISFPLYLWHWPLLVFGRDLVPGGAAGKITLLAASAVMAWATFALIEKPVRFGPRSPVKVSALAGSMLMVALVAAVLFQRSGEPARYPDIIRSATRYDLEEFRAGIRWKRCFLEFEQDAPEFAPECVESGKKPLVFLWGDSGGAALYPGFQALSERLGSFRIGQFTSSACPPIIDFQSARRPACQPNNRKALQKARALKPDVVVLAALWQYYDVTRLTETVTELQRMGIPRIIVVGPGLTWKEPPSRIILKQWQKDPLHRTPPTHLDYSQHEALSSGDYRWTPAVQAEALLRGIAEASGVEYISLLDILCNEKGCLTRSSSESGDSFFLDTAHLTPTGAKFAVGSMTRQLRLGPEAVLN